MASRRPARPRRHLESARNRHPRSLEEPPAPRCRRYPVRASRDGQIAYLGGMPGDRDVIGSSAVLDQKVDAVPGLQFPGRRPREGRHVEGTRVGRLWSRVLGVAALTLSLGILSGFALYATAAPRYVASSFVLLMPPAGTDAGANPYLRNGTLDRVVDVVVQLMAGDAARQNLEERGLGPATWTATKNSQSSSPALIVTAVAPSAAEAAQWSSVAAAEVRASVDQIQADWAVAPENRVTVYPMGTASVADADVGPAVRRGVIGGLGTAGVIGVGVVVIVWILSRRARHGLERVPQADPSAPRGTS